MVEKASNVVLNFKMDGQIQYAETLKQINSVMNVAAKEYKNHIASMGKDGSATDKLTAEKKKLEIQMEGARKRTKMLSDEFESMSKDTSTTTEQLTKMQGKLLDSERAEISLQKSMDRVNEGLSDQATEARDAQDTLDALKGETKLLDAEQKNLTSSFKLQNSELGENASEAEKAEVAQKQLQDQMELTDRIVNNLEQQLDASKRAYGDNSVEVKQLETKLNETRTEINKFEDSLKGIDQESREAGDGMEELGGKLNAENLFETAEALQGLSDKLLEIGQFSYDSALAIGDAQTYLQANLGLTEEKAEQLNEVVQDVFKNGVVESVEEAAEAVSLVKSYFEDLNDIELEKLTNQLTVISKRTGTDVKDNTNAAKKLMDEFGLSGEKSLDLIAAGYQNNLNKSDDFTDTIDEYSGLFEEAGFSGEEMIQKLEDGLEGGARNTDLVADAVKELQLAFGDGRFEANLENFSEGTGNLFEKWQNGEATMQEVMESIANDMEKMSPSEQQESLSLLTTQFEDLGIDASLALLGVSDSMEDVNGKADAMSEKSPTEKLQSGFRELQEELIPIGEKLVEFSLEVLPKVIDAVESLYEWFTNLSGYMQTFIGSFGGLTAIVIILSPIIATVVAGFIAFGSTMGVVIGVIAAVIFVISGFIALITNWGEITDWISEKWGQFTTWLGESTSKMKEIVVAKFNELREQAVAKFNELKDEAINKFNELKNKGSEIVDGLKSAAINKVTEMKNNFNNRVEELKNGVISKYEELKNRASETITSFKNNIINKATEMKTGFTNKASELKNSAIDKFNSLKESASRVFNNLKDAIMNPINKAKDLMGTAIEKMKGFLNFEWSLPKLKMPSVSVDMKENSWGIPYPDFNIKWNAKGGIFTQPTIFGASGGQLQGIGEAGPEAALPLNEQTLGDIGKGIAETMGNGDVNVTVYLDVDEVNQKLAPGMSRNIKKNNEVSARRIGVVRG